MSLPKKKVSHVINLLPEEKSSRKVWNVSSLECIVSELIDFPEETSEGGCRKYWNLYPQHNLSQLHPNISATFDNPYLNSNIYWRHFNFSLKYCSTSNYTGLANTGEHSSLREIHHPPSVNPGKGISIRFCISRIYTRFMTDVPTKRHEKSRKRIKWVHKWVSRWFSVFTMFEWFE